MSGVEFYPQKEFDEDMEDKSDNDKIRVSGLLLSLHDDCVLPLLSTKPGPPSPSSACTAPSEQNVRPLGHVVCLFHLINLVSLPSVH